MSIPKVRLYLRASLPDGSRPYLTPAYVRKGVVKPGHAILNDRVTAVSGSYHARYRNLAGNRVWRDLGNDAYVASDKLILLQRELEDQARLGLREPAKVLNKATLADATERYLERTKAKLSAKTYGAYSRYLALFAECVGDKVKYLDEINPDTLLAFETYLYERYPEKNGKKPQTPWNVFAGLNTFLRDRGIFLRNGEGKDVATKILRGIEFDEKIVDSREPEEIDRFLSACTTAEIQWFKLFLLSGVREQEAAHAEVGDLDPKTCTLHVQPKPHRNWRVKDKDDRFIPLPSDFVSNLLAPRKGHDKRALLFPNGKGRVEGHFLRKIKQIALRAGLNCGQCMHTWQGRPVCCADSPSCDKWTCHAVRRSYATIQHEQNGMSERTVQARLGHASPETTQRYLKATPAKSKQAREEAERFAGLFAR